MRMRIALVILCVWSVEFSQALLIANDKKVEIELDLDLADQSYTGSIKYITERDENKLNLTLLAEGITVQAAQVNINSFSIFNCVIDDSVSNQVTLVPPSSIGTKFDGVLTITFSGRIRNNGTGLFSSYSINRNTAMIAADVKYKGWIFPFKNINATEIELTFNLNLSNYEVLSEGETILENGVNMIRLNKIELGQLALIMVETDDGKYISVSSGDTKVWMPAGENEEDVQYTNYTLKELNNGASEIFPVQSKHSNLTLMSTPDPFYNINIGGSVRTVRESYLLLTNSTTRNKHESALALSSLATQKWFGADVRLTENTWLGNSMSILTKYLLLNKTEFAKDWNLGQDFVVDVVQSALEQDSWNYNTPLEPVLQKSSQLTLETKYAKGAALLSLLYTLVKEETFLKSVNTFLTSSSNNFIPSDFYQILESDIPNASEVLPDNVSVKEVMKNWTATAGFPVIEVHHHNGLELHLNQKTFDWNAKNLPSDRIIPLHIVEGIGGKPQDTKLTWMIKSDFKMNLTNNTEWYTLNSAAVGFFRVNYDKENWNALIKVLNRSHTLIAPEVRAQLIFDSVNLAIANYIDFELAFDLLHYLQHEREYIAWKAAFYSFGQLRRIVEGDPKGLQMINELVQKVSLNISQEIFKLDSGKNGVKTTANSDSNELMKMLILEIACMYQSTLCIQHAKPVTDIDLGLPVFNPHTNKTEKLSLTPNLRSILLCYSIQQNNAKWDEIYKKFELSKTENEREMYVEALACDKTPNLTKYLKTLITSNKVRTHYLTLAIDSACKHSQEGTTQAINFMSSNWNYILENFTSNAEILNKITLSMAKHVSTSDQLKKIKQLLDSDAGKRILDVKPIYEQAGSVVDGPFKSTKERVMKMLAKETGNGAHVSPSNILLVTISIFVIQCYYAHYL